MRSLLYGALLSVFLLPATAQAQAREQTATTTVAAPVFISPNESQAPLRVAKEGSVMLLLDTNGDWCHIEFEDPEFGRRTGYVQTKYVRIDRSPAAVDSPPARQSEPAPATRVSPRASAATPVSNAEQKSYSSKFFVGFGVEGNGIVTTESGIPSTTESGSGAGLILGYGFNPRWSIYGNFSGARINADGGGTYTLAHVDFGTRVHFLAGPSRVVPFIQLGLAGRAASGDIIVGSRTHTLTASGAGVAFGGGLNAHFTPAFAFSAAATWSVGNFSTYELDNRSVAGSSVSATSARIHLGVIWFPGAP